MAIVSPLFILTLIFLREGLSPSSYLKNTLLKEISLLKSINSTGFSGSWTDVPEMVLEENGIEIFYDEYEDEEDVDSVEYVGYSDQQWN